jgi:hypothetical protein
MADRDLVRDAGFRYYAWSFFSVFVAAPGGSCAVFAVGRGEFGAQGKITGDKIASGTQVR